MSQAAESTPGASNGATDGEAQTLVRAILPASLASVLSESDDAVPFADNSDYIRTLEALLTLQVALFKLSG